VAGGVALNELLAAPRISQDIDLFHDTAEALEWTWEQDSRALREAGFEVRVVRERPSFIEAEAGHGDDRVLLQWARDSAYRFFPLVRHEDLGLTLHPFDLATNKVLALVGRLEVRDWIDVIECHRRVQPLGYLAWAACGKDPGFSPLSLLEHAARTARYSRAEVAALAFSGPPPDAAALALEWRRLLAQAEELVELLPAESAGACVLARDGSLFRGDSAALRQALSGAALVFHPGRIRGALPTVHLATDRL
jgi:hypothetical protein